MGEGRSLTETPTWFVATVTTMLVGICFIVERSIHPLGEFSCYKPPTSCKFKYINATIWEKTLGPIHNKDPDCKTWSNMQEELCYDCISCETGVVANLKSDWHKLAIFSIKIIVVLISIYSNGYWAYINKKRERV